MIRTVVGRVATGAAGATAAASAVTTGQAHAHTRPMRLMHGTVVDERTANGGASLKIEDDWLVPQMQGDDVLFTAEEIEQTVDDICGIASSQSKVYIPTDTDSIETIDTDANAIIDEANIVPAGEGLQKLAKMTNIMLNRPSIQREIMEAFQQEPELRDMIQSLSLRQGGDLDLLTFGQRPALAAADPQVEDVTDAQPKNFLQSLVDDIGRGLEAAGDGLARTGARIGNFLGRIGRWLRKKAVGEGPEADMSLADGIMGLTMCFASVVMAVLVAKRVGVGRMLFCRC